MYIDAVNWTNLHSIMVKFEGASCWVGTIQDYYLHSIMVKFEARNARGYLNKEIIYIPLW